MEKTITINKLECPNLFNCLKQYYMMFRQTYVDNLKQADQVATGQLIDSLDYDIEVNGSIVSVKLMLLPYWGALEHGRKPTEHSSNAQLFDKIKEWKKAKGISTPNGMTEDQFIWATVNKIHRYGFYNTEANRNQHLGKHMLQKTINEINNKWINLIRMSLLADLKINLRKLIL